MCENRERLIGYVYDECDPAERQLIEAHLDDCPTCRQEIRGLRGVRQDLLAWDVPASEPIWRPIAPPRQESSWRAVPTWALAAAACATFMVGAAGGVVTSALMSRSVPAVAQTQTAPTPAQTAVAVTPSELTALEDKMLARVRAEFDARARQTSNDGVSRNVSSTDPMTVDLARRVNMLTARQNELSDLVLDFARETQGIRAKQTGLERTNGVLVSYIQSGAGSIPGGQ